MYCRWYGQIACKLNSYRNVCHQSSELILLCGHIFTAAWLGQYSFSIGRVFNASTSLHPSCIQPLDLLGIPVDLHTIAWTQYLKVGGGHIYDAKFNSLSDLTPSLVLNHV